MLNVANSKSVLAKLLAQENLKVEHRKVQTAYFDPMNRLLVLPIWKDMSNDLYDLLVGHEVGHAWETPPDGWHDAVTAHPKGFKSYLNVVEDARIEKKIKSRYPGLRSSFYKAYKDLHDKDFFGLSKYDINKLPLIDRINVHYKLGPFMNVPFKDQEHVFLKRIDNISTWDDVLSIAKDLYEYRKEEMQTEFDTMPDEWDEGDSSDFDDFDDAGGEGNGRSGSSESSLSEEGDEDSDSDLKSNDRKGGRSKEKDPKSLTDMHFREKEKSLISDKIKPYVYVDLHYPKNWRHCIISHSDVYSRLDWSYADNFKNVLVEYNVDSTHAEILNSSTLLSQYKERNSKFISYLVKEFELKRNAKQYARANVSKTGELDTEKVWSYKLRDDLFKRVTQIPKGKNHGMIMLIDWSGSMSDCLSDTIEQTLILADFCKKINIPFGVYAFSDCSYLSKLSNSDKENDWPMVENALVVFEYKHFNMIEFMNSNMSVTQYNEAQKRLLQIAKAFDTFSNSKLGYEGISLRQALHRAIPKELSLNGTPLNEALIICQNLVADFKESYRLDIMNFIVLSDGEGKDLDVIFKEGRRRLINYELNSREKNNYHLIIKDVKNNVIGNTFPGESITHAFLRMIKNRCNANIIGFYILPRLSTGYIASFLQTNGKDNLISSDLVRNEIKKNKFYDLQNTGYNKYFLITSKDLEIAEDKLVTENNSKRELMKAFLVNQKKKLVNRVFLNKFICEIA